MENTQPKMSAAKMWTSLITSTLGLLALWGFGVVVDPTTVAAIGTVLATVIGKVFAVPNKVVEKPTNE